MSTAGGNITLIGMPASGKSTIGVLLAKALGKAFVDVDLLIQQGQGGTLSELIGKHGLEEFCRMSRGYRIYS